MKIIRFSALRVMKVFRVSHGDSARLHEGLEMRGKAEVGKPEVGGQCLIGTDFVGSGNQWAPSRASGAHSIIGCEAQCLRSLFDLCLGLSLSRDVCHCMPRGT